MFKKSVNTQLASGVRCHCKQAQQPAVRPGFCWKARKSDRLSCLVRRSSLGPRSLRSGCTNISLLRASRYRSRV